MLLATCFGPSPLAFKHLWRCRAPWRGLQGLLLRSETLSIHERGRQGPEKTDGSS
ncbi:hypothetical protein GY45DRAFT_1327381 [Cubamyces sp. BRFM 1775]|nr:hypothetical protein GY45DRAFT_1327381 [Cubamyces sp. BRFM 1775]